MAFSTRRMLPKTRLHLFMTRTLVILRLNYRAGVKINSSMSFFLLFLLVYVSRSLIALQMNKGANILHTDTHTQKKEISRCVVGVSMRNRQMSAVKKERHALSQSCFLVSKEAFGTT